MSIINNILGTNMAHMKDLILSVCEDYSNGQKIDDIAITYKISISLVEQILTNFSDLYRD
jgi:hypothetical protein